MKKLLPVLFAAACSSSTPKVVPEQPLTVMTFNVENLFDTVHEEGKADQTYMPLSKKQGEAFQQTCENISSSFYRKQCLTLDWNEEVVKAKMRNLAATITQVNDGRGPDVLVLPEVENRQILERLRKEYLSELGYQPALLLEGQDMRGIDVGLLTRLEVKSPPQLHNIPFHDIPEEFTTKTRGILQVDLQTAQGQDLTVFGVHFPSQRQPTMMRKQGMEALRDLTKALPTDRLVIAAGDFNIIPSEEAELNGVLADGWTSAHRSSCKGCKGTHYYGPKKEWSFLDMIWIHAPEDAWNVTNAWVPSEAPGQKRTDGTPNRFSPKHGAGVSDHFPLAATLVKAPQP